MEENGKLVEKILEKIKKLKEKIEINHNLVMGKLNRYLKINANEYKKLKEQIDNHDKEKFRDLCHPTKVEYINSIERGFINKNVLQEILNINKRICHNLKVGKPLEDDWDEMWESFKLEISKLELKLEGEKSFKIDINKPLKLKHEKFHASDYIKHNILKNPDPKPSCNKCDSYGEMHGTRESMCFHKSFGIKAFFITDDFRCPKEGEKSAEVLRKHSVVDQQIKAEERFDSVTDSKSSINKSINGIYEFLLCGLDGRLSQIETGISILLKEKRERKKNEK